MPLLSAPRLETRDPQPCVALRATIDMPAIAATADRLFPELFAWLDTHHLQPAGPPFIRYLTFQPDGRLTLQVGVPTSQPVAGDARIEPDLVPGGVYAVALHTGAYDGLRAATGSLIDWAKANGVRWQAHDGVWAARLERYLTDPRQEPDPNRWQTELAFLTDRTAPATRSERSHPQPVG
jgi:effector-binding domain-containing protein